MIVKVILAIFYAGLGPTESSKWDAAAKRALGHVHVWHAAARRHCCGMKDIGTEARTKESKQGDINSEGPSVALVMPGGAG